MTPAPTKYSHEPVPCPEGVPSFEAEVDAAAKILGTNTSIIIDDCCRDPREFDRYAIKAYPRPITGGGDWVHQRLRLRNAMRRLVDDRKRREFLEGKNRL